MGQWTCEDWEVRVIEIHYVRFLNDQYKFYAKKMIKI